MNRRASILIFVVWVLAAFACMNAALYKIASAQMALSQRVEYGQIGHLFAQEAFECALREMRAAQKAQVSMRYNGIRRALYDSVEVTYQCIDEAGKININTAAPQVLARLPGFTQALAEAVAGCPRKPFSIPEELLLVPGVTPDVYNACREIITVYSAGMVNINTASERALQALGMDAALVDALMQYRKGPDGVSDTEDDRFITAGDSITLRLAQQGGLFAAQQAKLIELISQGVLGTRPGSVRVHVQIRKGPRIVAGYDIITDGARVQRWME